MFELSFAVLLLAVIFGAALALWHLRPAGQPPPAPLGILHGLLGAAGLALLLVALQAPRPTPGNGTGGFGVIAAVFLVLALLLGLVLLALFRAGRQPRFLIAAHAIIAIIAFVVLAAFLFAG